MDMITCDNCQMKFDPEVTNGCLLVQQGLGKPNAALLCAVLCAACTEGVSVLKVVLRRRESDLTFGYDSYQPVEATKRAFGK